MKTSLTFVFVGVGLIAALAPATFAATRMTMPSGHPMMMRHSVGTVYACAKCKEYYTPSQAKSMKYMDPMGHKLTKMPKAPAGYMAAGKSAM